MEHRACLQAGLQRSNVTVSKQHNHHQALRCRIASAAQQMGSLRINYLEQSAMAQN